MAFDQGLSEISCNGLQRPTEAWHEMIGDPTCAGASLDRIIHSAHRLKLGGGSIRDPARHDAAP